MCLEYLRGGSYDKELNENLKKELKNLIRSLM